MKYSFILCTSNSERIIKQVLKSIATQQINKNNFEIILADYKSYDNTVKVIKKFVELIDINDPIFSEPHLPIGSVIKEHQIKLGKIDLKLKLIR